MNGQYYCGIPVTDLNLVEATAETYFHLHVLTEHRITKKLNFWKI